MYQALARPTLPALLLSRAPRGEYFLFSNTLRAAPGWTGTAGAHVGEAEARVAKSAAPRGQNENRVLG